MRMQQPFLRAVPAWICISCMNHRVPGGLKYFDTSLDVPCRQKLPWLARTWPTGLLLPPSPPEPLPLLSRRLSSLTTLQALGAATIIRALGLPQHASNGYNRYMCHPASPVPPTHQPTQPWQYLLLLSNIQKMRMQPDAMKRQAKDCAPRQAQVQVTAWEMGRQEQRTWRAPCRP